MVQASWCEMHIYVILVIRMNVCILIIYVCMNVNSCIICEEFMFDVCIFIMHTSNMIYSFFRIKYDVCESYK